MVVGVPLILWFIFRRQGQAPQLAAELALVDANLATKKIVIEHGKQKALEEQDKAYEHVLEKLDENDTKKAEALRLDPVKRHDFLFRAARR